MLSISSDLLQTWVIGLLWPLTRVLGVIASAPLFSHAAVANRVKLGLGIMITLVIMPTLPVVQFAIFSFQGLLLLIQQLVIGLAIGFSMRLVFSAVDLAGQMMSMSMGLGFATFFDPQSQGQSSAVNQFLMLVVMLIFLSLDGHLMMVSAIVQSFVTMPIGTHVGGINTMQIVQWGSTIFSVGLLLSLPVITALLITNMALGILSRTAPQLNLFGIGFPITLSVGLVSLALALPSMLKPIERLIELGGSYMQQVATPTSTATPANAAATTH